MALTTAPAVRVLLIEDSPADADLIREMLLDLPDGGTTFDLEHVDRLARGVARLVVGGIGLVLLDLSLPDSHGFETFARLRAAAPSLPIVVMSGLDDEALAVRAVREGAQDYLVKGRGDGEVLARTMRYAVERKRAELEEAARVKAEAALRARDELLGTVSHDLKAPLTSIKGMAQLLVRRFATGRPLPPEELIEQLNVIVAAAQRMAEQLDELVQATRLAASEALELDRRPTDLVALARRAVDELHAIAAGQSVRCDAGEDAVVGEWDARRLERVLTNLLDNAVKYSPTGGEIVVTVGMEKADGGPAWAVLAVRDHGIGIPSADLPRVFERFHRGANVAGRIPGAGIGLAGVRQIVEQHGGTIAVESREGQGSTFRVRLPLGG